MKVFVLKKPFEWGGEQITELRQAKELKARDFRGMPVDMVDFELILAGRFFGKEEAFIDEISAHDWIIIKNYLLDEVLCLGNS